MNELNNMSKWVKLNYKGGVLFLNGTLEPSQEFPFGFG